MTIEEGWLRAIDDEMTSCHIGVANADDSYQTARNKLHRLIDWHVMVATGPCVNGGFELVKVMEYE